MIAFALRSMKSLAFAALAMAMAGPAARPLAASDLYTVNEKQPLDPARRPAPGKTLIYFVRPQTFGGAVKVKLYADGKFQSFVMSKTFVAMEVEPGKHEFVAAAENAGFLTADLAADRIYLVQVAIHMGVWKARTHFEVARPGTDAMKEAVERKDDLRAIETTEAGFAWVKERQDDFQKTMDKYRSKGEEFELLKPEDGTLGAPWLPNAPAPAPAPRPAPAPAPAPEPAPTPAPQPAPAPAPAPTPTPAEPPSAKP